MARFGRRLSSQIFVFQVLILVGTLLVGVLLALNAWRSRLDDEHQRRALGIGRTVAATPEFARALAARDPTGLIQKRAEAVRRRTGTSSVVVADRRGIRYSHPVPARIGERVSTPPTAAMTGREALAVETGTLGRTARAKVPLRTANGRLVGQVTVTIPMAAVNEDFVRALPLFALYGGVSLAIGLVASILLARRLKNQTFGLELGEIASLLREREATLRGIREGVVAVDPAGRVQLVNREAGRLLDLPDDVVGRPAGEAAGGRLGDLLEGRLAGEDLLLVHGDRVLLASRMPVRRDGRDLGAVVTLRDRTELEALARELDSVRDLTDAMRAQAHEFSNRLHTISGLLELGHGDDALAFMGEISRADAELRHLLGERVADPHVAGLLLAKGAVAPERGVVLRLAPDLRVSGELVDPPGVLTVLGNLLDNAMDAAPGGHARPPWVEVALVTEPGGALRIRVDDSGPGVPPPDRERIFEAGYSTKASGTSGARGVGLPLVRRTVERRGGAVRVGPAAGGGARFEVELPEAVVPEPVEPLLESEAGAVAW